MPLPLVLLTAILAGLPACSAPPPAAPPVSAHATSPTVITTRGDWDDVPAALEVALSRAQMAILRQSLAEPDRIIYELLMVSDEPARLTITRTPGAGDNLIDIRLEARAGNFGDPQREADLLTPLAARLTQLAGVDHAPL